jgi:hypothetical protein
MSESLRSIHCPEEGGDQIQQTTATPTSDYQALVPVNIVDYINCLRRLYLPPNSRTLEKASRKNTS